MDLRIHFNRKRTRKSAFQTYSGSATVNTTATLYQQWSAAWCIEAQHRTILNSRAQSYTCPSVSNPFTDRRDYQLDVTGTANWLGKVVGTQANDGRTEQYEEICANRIHVCIRLYPVAAGGLFPRPCLCQPRLEKVRGSSSLRPEHVTLALRVRRLPSLPHYLSVFLLSCVPCVFVRVGALRRRGPSTIPLLP